MMTWISKKARAFSGTMHDETGGTLIEFAIAFPILLLFVFAILTFGIVIFESAVLQGALNAASREGKTGYPDISDPGFECQNDVCKYDAAGNIVNYAIRWKQISGIIQTQTQSVFDQKQLKFSITAYPDFIALMSGMPGNADDLGASGVVVVYTASYPYPSFLLSLLGMNSESRITAYNIVRNEGF